MYFIEKFIIRYFVKIWEFIFGRAPEKLPKDGSLADSVRDNLEDEGIVIQKGAWDKFIDGLNRLPRPIGTFGVYALIATAVTNPEQYKTIMLSLASTPDMVFVIYLTIIGFWFGGKIIQQANVNNLLKSMKQYRLKEGKKDAPPLRDEKTKEKTKEGKKEKIDISEFDEPE